MCEKNGFTTSLLFFLLFLTLLRLLSALSVPDCSAKREEKYTKIFFAISVKMIVICGRYTVATPKLPWQKECQIKSLFKNMFYVTLLPPDTRRTTSYCTRNFSYNVYLRDAKYIWATSISAFGCNLGKRYNFIQLCCKSRRGLLSKAIESIYYPFSLFLIHSLSLSLIVPFALLSSRILYIAKYFACIERRH